MANDLKGAAPGPADGPVTDQVRRRPDLLLAAAVAALVFSWNYTVERVLDRDKVFAQYDVLFNADPITRLRAIGNGVGDVNDLIIHPGFKVYFSRPIRLAAKVVRGVGVIPDTSRAEYDLRRELALLIVPAASALTMAGAFVLFTCVGLSRPSALLMTLICCASFSQLVFGSLPDHMPISGLAVTALLLLAADMAARGGAVRWAAWPLVGGLYAGTTITNAAPFVVLFATARAFSGRPWRRAARDLVLVTAAMLAVTAGVAVAGRVVAGKTPWPVGKVRHHAASYLKRDFHKAPAALLETFAPAALVVKPMPAALRKHNWYASGRSTPRIETSQTSPPALVALFVALVAAGAAAWVKGGGSGRAVGVASAGVVAFHLGLHSVWGDAFFLYSQHWLVPLGFLLAGNLTWPGAVGRAFTAGYGAAGVAMFFHNGALLNQIFATIAVTTP